jgi:hypothetical protein
MTAPAVLVPLLEAFVECFTTPGFSHFTAFIVSHAALWGAPHRLTEVMRFSGLHRRRHWTAPYAWLRRGRCSCRLLSQKLLDLLLERLGLCGELVLVIDDTLIKKWGRRFWGLGCYRDPTDKNPGASQRRVWGHPWVVLALLVQRAGRWFCFPLSARLFVPDRVGQKDWPFAGKIELAADLIGRLEWGRRKATVVVDNLYAKACLLWAALEPRGWTLVSRLRSNAALYLPPQPRKAGGRGRPRKRGPKRTARQLWSRRSSGRRKLTVHIYGKKLSIQAWVGVLIPSATLGDNPILAVIFPDRSGRMLIFFSTDLQMDPCGLLELYGARFKIEDAFDEMKTHGGLGDYQVRSLPAMKRHVTLCRVAYSLPRLLAIQGGAGLEIAQDPWWHPPDPPSVTRVRRALFKLFPISPCLPREDKHEKIPPLQRAA